MKNSKFILIAMLITSLSGISAQITELEGNFNQTTLFIKNSGDGIRVLDANSRGIWIDDSKGTAGLFQTKSSSVFPAIEVQQQNSSIAYHDIRLSGSRIIGSTEDILMDIDSDTDNTSEDPNFFGIIHGDKDDPVFLVDQDGGVRADGNLFAKRINVGSIDDSVADIEIGGANAIIKANSNSSNLQLESNGHLSIRVGLGDGGAASRFRILNPSLESAFSVDDQGVTRVGNVLVTSDRNKKENISVISSETILKNLIEMPIYKWNYKKIDRQHIGPMAQDFLAAFNLGNDGTTISTIDSDGISLAAIKGLYELMQEELKAKSIEISSLIERIEALENK